MLDFDFSAAVNVLLHNPGLKEKGQGTKSCYCRSLSNVRKGAVCLGPARSQTVGVFASFKAYVKMGRLVRISLKHTCRAQIEICWVVLCSEFK